MNTKEIEELLGRIDLEGEAPVDEPQRQYYFLKKCRSYVKAEEEKLGRPLTACVTTFGCQMNARDSEKLSGILELAGYTLTEEEDCDFNIYNTCTVRDNAIRESMGGWAISTA